MTNAAVIDREAESIARSVGIPPCPAILTGLVAEMRSEDPDFPKIAKLIGTDVALAATMLKTVNSPFYGLPQKISSIQQALALLGLRNVSHLVTRLLLQQAFPVGDGEAMERYWESSSSIAVILAWLARKTKKLDRDDAYTYGLFRDCGIPVMMMNFTDHPEILDAAYNDPARVLSEIENEQLGIDHAGVGAELAESWHLSAATCAAIRHHHDYAVLGGGDAVPLQSFLMIALGVIAERLYRDHCGDSPGVEWQRAGAAALQAVGLGEEELGEFSADIDEVLAAK